ncbi:hypothetical protein [Paludisphaera soli]|uniref:hypothetical protein n=1 Tax=Paludisphaera soli TaxID=2712865 RepID=UPI0013EC248C|nr:hypothetical protein [Paludisphaera soli]
MNFAATFSAGFAIKVFETLADSSLYLLLGLIVSALLRAAVGPARLRAWFGDHRWSALLRAWAAAVVLPVCSLGVLPVLHELKRSGSVATRC